jgi:hypothetical protein
MRRLAGAVLMAAAATFVSGCGEGSQVVVYKQGKYQGKPDGKPEDSQPPSWSTAQKWDRGNKVAWEAAIKSRSANQNEYTRTE